MIVASEPIGPEPWHGTIGGTSNHKCKCLACRTVWAQYAAMLRKWKAQRIDPDDARHGTSSFYLNHRCRCDKCRAANTAAKRAYLARKAAA